MKPKHKAGKRRKCVSNATTARIKRNLYTSFKSRKHILTNHRLVRVNGFIVNKNTEKKSHELNQFNEAHNIQAQGGQE